MSPPTLAAMYDQANGDAESSLMDAGLQPEQEAPMQPEQEAPVVQPEAEQASSEEGVDETASAMLDVPSESGRQLLLWTSGAVKTQPVTGKRGRRRRDMGRGPPGPVQSMSNTSTDQGVSSRGQPVQKCLAAREV
jgi:hypothetical protein